MVLTKYVNYTVPTSASVNVNFNKGFSFAILNKIRQNIDRVSVTSVGGDDIFTEAYTDSNGMNNSVSEATGFFDVNKYKPGFEDEASGDTTYDPSGFTNPENAFDNDNATYANILNDGIDGSLGKTFDSKYVYYMYIYTYGSSGTNWNITVQTYNGSIWSTIETHDSGGNSSNYKAAYYLIDDTIQGVKVSFNKDGVTDMTGRLYTLSYGDENLEDTIIHTIPSGTFSATISKIIAKVLFEDYEDGIDVQHKIINSTEDSGWVGDGELVSFNSFSSEPTEYHVKLIRKITSPTINHPSIRGTGLRCL